MNGHHRFAALSLRLFLLWIPLSAAEPDAATRYAEKAIALLEDGISRQTVHGEGNVPAYAESLRAIFLAGGFPPESISIIPYGETASLIVRYAGDEITMLACQLLYRLLKRFFIPGKRND